MVYGFNPCKSDPTVMRKTTSAGYVVLAIYVDDILLTGNDDVLPKLIFTRTLHYAT